MKSMHCLGHEGIEIVRGLINPSLARAFQHEMLQHQRVSFMVNPKAPGYMPEFFSTDLERTMTASNYPAAQRVFKILGVGAGTAYESGSVLNYQPPHVSQEFHRDNPIEDDRVIILHGGDDGAFDYSVNARNVAEAESDYKTVELSAGDIVIQTMPYILHRGRNRGDTPRFTAAFARVIENDYFGPDR